MAQSRMTDPLGVFLRAQAGRSFDYGVTDCLLLPADWAMVLGYPDPAAGFRGVYADAGAADAIVSAHGGLPDLIAARLTGSPARLVTNAVRGDVGVVVVSGRDGRAEVGAICTGRRWAVRAERGLWIGPAEAVAIWRLEEP